MPLIKPRTRGKQLVRHIVRLDRETNETLFAYAQFLGEPTDYVLNQVIDTVLAKDKDLRFASRENAVLGQFEEGAGFIPGGGPMARLSRLVGRGRALEILLFADDFDAARAEQYGYVNRAIADDQLDAEVDAMALRLAGFDRDAIARTKAHVDQVTLPPDNELPPALLDFRQAFGRPGPQARLAKLERLGLNIDSDLERHLGRRVVEAAP